MPLGICLASKNVARMPRYYEQIRSAFAEAGVGQADERWVIDCVLGELETTKSSVESEAQALVHSPAGRPGAMV